MKWLLLALALGACASQPPPEPVALLRVTPEQSYRELGTVEARGSLGTRREAAYDELREKARALGADAVVLLSEERLYHPPTPPEGMEDRPSIGDAYPEPLERTVPGRFGYEGTGVQIVAGSYWQVRGLAVELK